MRTLIQSLSKHEGALPMSWSRINCLSVCPRQYDLRYRQRIKEVAKAADPSAMEAGKLIHSALESAVKRCYTADFAYENSGYESLWNRVYAMAREEGTRERLLALREPSAKVLARILNLARMFDARVCAERKLMMNRDWEYAKKCSWDDMAWLGYVDLEMIAGDKCIIVDYKSEHFTQKRAESTTLQTLLYANAVFRREPEVQQVQTGCAYLLDARVDMNESILRSDMDKITEQITSLFDNYLRLLESGIKEPRVSEYCAWCGYSSDCPAQKEVNNGSD